jgi:outer membrane lipoprotein-sorting protein
MKNLKLMLALLMLATMQYGFAQKDPAARKVLDATAAKFSKSGGVKATFTAENIHSGHTDGTVGGVILLKGKKFYASTNQSLTWFDGKTEWTLMKNSNEVNVSTPDALEQQKINPYAFVNLYKKGFNYSVTNTTLRGKAAYEVHLKAESRSQALQEILITVDKSNYSPMCIRMRSGAKDWMRILVSSFATNEKFNDSTFRFNAKDFPKAEVIDLR